MGSCPLLILLAKSETRAIHVSQAGRNWVCQGLGRHENDFASSIIFGEQGIGLLPATLGIGSNWTRWRLLRHLLPLYPAPAAWCLSQLAPRITKSDDDLGNYDEVWKHIGTGGGLADEPGGKVATTTPIGQLSLTNKRLWTSSARASSGIGSPHVRQVIPLIFHQREVPIPVRQRDHCPGAMNPHRHDRLGQVRGEGSIPR